MTFISCRDGLTIMLARATRVEMGSEDGEGRVRLPDVNIGRLSGLKYKLVCRFELAVGMVDQVCCQFENTAPTHTSIQTISWY